MLRSMNSFYNMKYILIIQLLSTLFLLYVLMRSDYRWNSDRKGSQTLSTFGDKCPVNKLKLVMHRSIENLKSAQDSSNLGIMKNKMKNLENQLHDVLTLLSNENLDEFDAILQHFSEYKISTNSKKSVCSEVYDEKKRDYPLFKHGWELQNCKDNLLKDVLSIGLVASSSNDSSVINSIIEKIGAVYPGMTIILSSKAKLELKNLNSVNLLHVKPKVDNTSALNDIVETCRTPYLLMAKNVSMMRSRDARLERLVRVLSATNSDLAGGSSRDSNGRWKLGCEQMRLQSNRLQYIGGYYQSFDSCTLCHSVSGPFVIKTEPFKKFTFDESLNVEQQIEDMFIRRFKASKNSWLCPDSMFFIDNHKEYIMNNEEKWKELGLKHNFQEVMMSNGSKYNLPCRYDDAYKKTVMNSPCVQKDLNDGIHHVMRVCKEMDIMCELSEGTIVGAVKVSKSLPWDVDADIVVYITKNETKDLFKKNLEKTGYTVLTLPKLSMWIMKTSYGRVEMRLTHFSRWLDSHNYNVSGLKPTKVFFDGHWHPTLGNPGLAIRNRYGSEVYKHVEHWSVLKHNNSQQSYSSGAFKECTYPGNNACLDQFSPDGNIQFLN